MRTEARAHACGRAASRAHERPQHPKAAHGNERRANGRADDSERFASKKSHANENDSPKLHGKG
ncbi:MAG: hypothetical protein HGA93_03330 [Methanothrix sp.]|nr:hypothetical protein [Methanothrix sp.]